VFDVGGALTGLGNLAGLLNEGHVPGTTATYLAASAGTALGAWTGTTPLIVAAESAVGIKEGGRTGLVAATVAACFGASLFLAPLLQVGGGGGGAGGAQGQAAAACIGRLRFSLACARDPRAPALRARRRLCRSLPPRLCWCWWVP
jgi:hypothetical protein